MDDLARWIGDNPRLQLSWPTPLAPTPRFDNLASPHKSITTVIARATTNQDVISGFKHFLQTLESGRPRPFHQLVQSDPFQFG